MDTVKCGQMGVNRAAEQFGVPKTMLKDRLSGRVEPRSKSGLAQCLNKHDEELFEFLIEMAKIGYGKTKQEVISFANTPLKRKVSMSIILLEKGGGCSSSNATLEYNYAQLIHLLWFAQIVLAKKVFDDYFKLLESTLDSLKLAGKPQCIYNMDEMGMPLNAKQLKRIAPNGMKKVHGQSSGNKTLDYGGCMCKYCQQCDSIYGNIRKRAA